MINSLEQLTIKLRSGNAENPVEKGFCRINKDGTCAPLTCKVSEFICPTGKLLRESQKFTGCEEVCIFISEAISRKKLCKNASCERASTISELLKVK